MFFIFATFGLSKSFTAKHMAGVISGISVAACYLVFTYNSPAILKFYSKHSVYFNFLVFNAICVPLGYGIYFLEYNIIQGFTNHPNFVTLITFRQQIVFFTLAINTWFDGIFKGPWHAQAFAWYIIGWIIYSVFASDIVHNSSFTENLQNNYLYAAGFISSCSFCGLTRLSNFRHLKNKCFVSHFSYLSLMTIGYFAIAVGITVLYTKEFSAASMNCAWTNVSYGWLPSMIFGRWLTKLFPLQFIETKFGLFVYFVAQIVFTVALSIAYWAIW